MDEIKTIKLPLLDLYRKRDGEKLEKNNKIKFDQLTMMASESVLTVCRNNNLF